eukprot:765597-Ditylum_brightwellii.AAC.1
MVITAYRVCKNTLATSGENTCWMQQWRALCKKGITTPDHCQQFMKDFVYFLEEQLNKNEEIILGIDINEANLPATEIQQLACQLDLINVHHHLHGDTQ